MGEALAVTGGKKPSIISRKDLQKTWHETGETPQLKDSISIGVDVQNQYLKQQEEQLNSFKKFVTQAKTNQEEQKKQIIETATNTPYDRKGYDWVSQLGG